jgi:predicted acylesterase/phospholipase RssA
MESHLPVQPFNTLAVSMSGGGYRAASFHLGMLSYLAQIKWDGIPLLERVRVISTVSGGTFTGVCYAAALARGESFEDFYRKLYAYMHDTDLIKEALKKLSDKKNWKGSKGRSLINAFSLVYFDKLGQDTFRLLFDKRTHLTEIIFNATEFHYGLPFRFQRTEPNPTDYNAYIGNRQVCIPPEALKEVRLSDAIAASSCFPMGFEPINFPTDFIHDGSPTLKELKQSWQPDQYGDYCPFPIGLMDGGIVDNQGIDSVFWAEDRMHHYQGELKKMVSDDAKAIDLFIISDVSSPFMDGYVKSEEKPLKGWRNLNLKRLGWIGAALILGGVASTVLGAMFAGRCWMYIIGALAALLFVGGTVSLLVSNLLRMIMKGVKVPEYFIKHLGRFNALRFGIYENLLKNRISSVMSMVSEVFMKQIRRREYRMVYDKESGWLTRLIMNAVYELTEKQTRYRNNKRENAGRSPELRNVSPQLMEIAELAKSMGTTLWFTPDEINDEKKNKLDALIATGQFTACFNLLEYIEKTLKHPDHKQEWDAYAPELKAKIDELYNKMMKDWHDFNANPYWMVRERQ